MKQVTLLLKSKEISKFGKQSSLLPSFHLSCYFDKLNRKVGLLCPLSIPSKNYLHFGLFVLQGNEDKWRVIITCTRTEKLDWYPDPANLRCIPSCSKAELADGLCDAINNNKHCRWDGGDCCPSTTKNRIVRKYPRDCKSECACKDPDAKENEASGLDDEDDEDDGEKPEGSGSDDMLIIKDS